MSGIIYGICKPEEEQPFYIGQTLLPPMKRFRDHERACAKGSSLKVHRTMQKYGYQFKILATAIDDAYLDSLEVAMIAQWSTFSDDGGANLTLGGNSGRRAEDTKKKIAEANRRRTYKPLSAERKALISLQQKGAKRPQFSDEHKAKLSAARKGKSNGPCSEKTKKILSDQRKGKKQTAEHVANNKAAQNARNWTPTEEHKLKLIAANTGRTHSEEERNKRSHSAKFTKRAKLLAKHTGITYEKICAEHTLASLTDALEALGKLPKREKYERVRQSG